MLIQVDLSSIPQAKRIFPKNGHLKGFTMLEILVAITIFAVVITTLFTSFNTVFSSADALEKNINFSEMANDCLNRITLDLTSIHLALPPRYAPPGFDDPADKFRLKGENVEVGSKTFSFLRFSSLAHIPLNRSARQGIAIIIYYITKDQDGCFIMKRSDELYPYPDFEEKEDDPILCEYIKSFELVYFDDEDNATDYWDSESDEFKYATPVSIGVKLELGLEPGLEPGDESFSRIFETRVYLPVIREKI